NREPKTCPAVSRSDTGRSPRCRTTSAVPARCGHARRRPARHETWESWPRVTGGAMRMRTTRGALTNARNAIVLAAVLPVATDALTRVAAPAYLTRAGEIEGDAVVTNVVAASACPALQFV